MTKHFTIIEAMDSPKLFLGSFAGPSWNGWQTLLKAAYALPMTEDEIVFFRSIAGGRDPPTKRVKELWIVAGRRAGKDSISSLIMAHTAALFHKDKRLRAGEKPLCLALACDRDQAKIILNYTRSYFADIPVLKKLVRRETANGLELTNSVEIATGTNSYRAVRGRPILCVVLDEVAFYRQDESALPDEATYAALVPGMMTMQPDAMLIGISTPHRKSGLLYRKYDDHFGKNSDDVLVIQAATRMLNPLIKQSGIDAALLEDPIHGDAEWNAVFRDELSGYLTREDIDAAVERDVTVRPPQPNIQYFSFTDGSGGRNDSFCSGVAHLDGNNPIIDCLLEIRAAYGGAKFDPDSAVTRIADMLKQYRCFTTTGDHYSGEWIVGAFKKHGISYRNSDRNKSKIYIDALPLFTSGRARILDNKRLIKQLSGLERTATASGDKVDHIRGQHDDLANVACGALVLAAAVKHDVIPVLAFDVLTGSIVGGPHSTALQPGQSEAARAAKERAMQPSAPRSPAVQNSTTAFYEWSGSGGNWEPPGGYTKRERF